MNRIPWILRMVVAAVTVSVASGIAQPETAVEGTAGSAQFACGLYARLAAQGGNLFFSPYSISAALALTQTGARGETAAEMAAVLHATPESAAHARAALDAIQSKGDVELATANSIWPRQDGRPLLPEYTDTLQTAFGAAVFPSDYARDADGVRKAINAWTAEKTHNKIRDLLAPGVLTSATRLTLVNAVYFNGKWATPFSPNQTEDAVFHQLDGTESPVRLMKREMRCAYGEEDGLQWVELPYRGWDVSMVILLPAADALHGLEERLTAENLSGWISRTEHRKVRLHLPKFRMEWGTRDIADTLREMGIRKAFTPAADFSGMDGEGGLVLDFVMHKAVVEVEEQGTEAAAATAVGVKAVSRPIFEPVPIFRADRPFVFLIRAVESGQILFMGRLSAP